MTPTLRTYITAMTVFAALMIPVRLEAQEQPAQETVSKAAATGNVCYTPR